MVYSPTNLDTAQLLLKEIGPERVEAYIVARLTLGEDLPTKNLLIRAYARLAGVAGVWFLRSLLESERRRPENICAVIEGLADVAVRTSNDEIRGTVVDLAERFLGDFSQMVRSAAALALVKLDSKDTAGRLEELLEPGGLDLVTTEEVRKYLEFYTERQTKPRVERIHFVNRVLEIRSLREALDPDTGVRIFGLMGVGGIGKTFLAKQYFVQAPHAKKIWLSLDGDFRGLAEPDLSNLVKRQLMERASEETASGPDEGTTFSETSPLLDSLFSNSILLVIDDYERSSRHESITSQVVELIRVAPKLQCLIIGRRLPASLDIPRMTLSTLTADESWEYLRQHAPLDAARQIDPNHDAQAIINFSQGVPLLLSMFAPGLARPQQSPPDFDQLQGTLLDLLGATSSALSQDERRFLIVLAQFDGAVDLNSRVVLETFRDENVGSPRLLAEGLLEAGLLTKVGSGSVIFYHPALRDSMRKMSDQRSILRINNRLAQLFLDSGDHLAAARHLARADQKTDAFRLVVNHVFEIVNRGQAAVALRVLDEEIGGWASEITTEIEALNAKGSFFAAIGDFSKARDSYARATKIGSESRIPWDEIATQFGLAMALRGLGDLQEASAALNRASEASRVTRDSRGQCVSMLGLAKILFAQGDFHGARTASEAAHECAVKLGDKRVEGECLTVLGRVYQRLGVARIVGTAEYRNFLSQSLTTSENALAVNTATGNKQSQTEDLGNLGLVYTSLGRSEKTLDYLTSQGLSFLNRALEMGLDLGNRASEREWLMSLGDAYLADQSTSFALDYYLKALEACQLTSNRWHMVELLERIGKAYENLGDYVNAAMHVEQLIALYRELGQNARADDWKKYLENRLRPHVGELG